MLACIKIQSLQQNTEKMQALHHGAIKQEIYPTKHIKTLDLNIKQPNMNKNQDFMIKRSKDANFMQ